MRFLADEHIPTRLVQALRLLGHEVIRASGPPLTGASDDLLFRVARRRRAVLLTLDLDFANLQRYPPGTHPGIVILRTHSQSAQAVTDATLRFLRMPVVRSLRGALIIVEDARTRVRRP